MIFYHIPVLSWKTVARDARENPLAVLRDLCSPLPEIPPATEFGFLDRRQRAELVGTLRRTQRRCSYCGGGARHGDLDHMIPKCRGGSNSETNLTLSCHSCNRKKGNRTAEEFHRDLLVAARMLRQRLRRRELVAA